MNAPNPILISGLYSDKDATKGDGLNAYLRGVWHNWGIDVVTSVFDRDLMALIPATGPIPVLDGHSFGGDAVIELAWKLYHAGDLRPVYIVVVDPVPKSGFSDEHLSADGFLLPPNVVGAFCIYRKTRSDGKTPITAYFSRPIATVDPRYINQVYIPHPGATHDLQGHPVDPQADEHGQPIRMAEYGVPAWVKKFMALSVAPISTPSPAPVPSMPVTLESLAEVQANHERRIAAMEDKLKQQP